MFDQQPIGSLLKQLTETLEPVSESPRLDAELLLGRAIDMPRAYLFAHPEDVPDDAALARLDSNLERRLAGEPMAYITGSKEFWSMELIVSPATLIPRPETEILVDVALREIPRKAEWNILDLGTGCGAIALAIARERPSSNVAAVDVSGGAIAVANMNARELGITNARFIEGDWLRPVTDEAFDLIVSNPPYVRDDDPALAELTSEPIAALAAGPDGLDALARLARDCVSVLRPGRMLALEHGAEQQQAVASILRDNSWIEITCIKDYAGLPRVTTARRAENCAT